jgi:hypothetical protein
MDTLFNNNPPMPSNDVIVNPENPENPDSKPLAAARIISIDDWVSGGPMYFWRDRLIFEIYLLTPGFESGFTGFSGLQRTSSFWRYWLFVEDYHFTLLFAAALCIGEKPGNESTV